MTNYAYYAMGCCQSTAISKCTLQTTCMDYTQLPECNSACASNLAIGKWYVWWILLRPALTLNSNNVDYPYCFLLEEIFSDGTYTGWQCATTPGILTIYPTPLGNAATTPPATTPHVSTTVSPVSSVGGGGSGSNSNTNTNNNGDNGNGNTVNVNVGGKSGAATGGLLDLGKQFKSYIYIEYGFLILMSLYLQ